MGKIGRNDLCPCGSGKKFKRCCYGKPAEAVAAASPQISLQEEVKKTQEDATARRPTFRPLGVFILFSTEAGDGWLLELTDLDAVQIAKGGEAVELDLAENADTIEINWSHTFNIKNRQFVLTAYADKQVSVFDDYPTQKIQSTLKKIRKKFSPELLKSLHVQDQAASS